LTRSSIFKKKISFNTEKYSISSDGDYMKIFNKNFSKIRKKFRINESNLFLDFLKKNKINNQKIVTIHLRSSHLKKLDGETYRSVEPKNYIKTINWLCKKNFKVIKFGNKDLNLKIKNKNFLDLDKFDLNRSQFEEIFVNLVSNSYFSICTNSGPSILNFIYDIPCFFSNGVPMGHSIFFNYKSVSTFKLYYSLISKKFLSINEIKKMNLDNFRLDTLFANNKIKLIDNTSDDILLVTKELIKKIKRNNFKSNLFANKINFKIKADAYCKHSQGTVSENFVKKYKNIL